jgi:hypothetical protein
VGVEESLFNRIGVFICIYEGVVEPVVIAPAERASLRRQASKKEEKKLYDGVRFIAKMRVEAVVAGRDGNPRNKDEGNGGQDQGKTWGIVEEIERETHGQKDMIANNIKKNFPTDLFRLHINLSFEATIPVFKVYFYSCLVRAMELIVYRL